MKNNHSMPNGKTKEKSEKSGIGAKGGGNKMAKQQGVAPSKPGQVSTSSSSSGNSFGVGKNAGKGRMAKQQGADPAKPGTSSPSTGGPTKWGVSGGGTKMAGKTGSQVAKAR